MNFEVKFMPEAEDSYTSLSTQIIEIWGYRTLNNLEIKLRKVLKQLVISPYLYPVVDEFTEFRRCVLHKNCSMIYKVVGYIIVIVCFWDNRQEPLISQ